MKKFNEWLNESVSITIKDYTASSYKDIYELSWNIGSKVRHLPGANKATNSEFLTIDGGDTWKTEGVLNFYHQGIPPENLPKILSAISYYLKEAGVEIGQWKTDISNLFKEPVARIAVKMHPQGGAAPEVNMANEMAEIIFHGILNLPRFNVNNFEIAAADLLIKLGSVNDFAIKNAVQEPTRQKNLISTGVSEDRIRRHLENLEKLAHWATENGYQELQFS
jgi:hypothetical protein